jgi:hypothetical protein
LYQNAGQSIPVSFEIVAKTEHYTAPKTGKPRRRSPMTKNERFRQMLAQCVHNQIPLSYILADTWFASAENMRFIHLDLEKDFIFPLKTNRKIALSQEDKQQGRYQRVDTLPIEPGTVADGLSRTGPLSATAYPSGLHKRRRHHRLPVLG